MLLKAICIIIFTLSLCINTYAQSESMLRISDISFSGLEKTKEQYLLDVIGISLKDVIDLDKIKSVSQRLKNTPGIGQVDYQLDTIDQLVYVNFKVDEIRTLLPILNFGGLKNNLWYQIGFIDNNWLGKGYQITGSYQNNDGLHSGQLYFKAPRLLNSKLGYSISIASWRSLEPLRFSETVVDYNYNNNSLGLTGLYNFTINKKIELGATAFNETFSQVDILNEDLPGPKSLKLNKLLSKLEYSVNRINYHYFYRQGHAWKTTYQNVYTTDDRTWFNSIQTELKSYFRPYKNINLALRINLGISTNNDSPFAPFVTDSHTNLRGVGNKVNRGTAQAVLNIEYRHTIWHMHNWGAQVVGFTDMGALREPGGDIEDLYDSTNLRQFVGGGFRLIYQKVYGAILRIDYGYNIYDGKDKGFVIGLGQYF